MTNEIQDEIKENIFSSSRVCSYCTTKIKDFEEKKFVFNGK